MINKIILVLTVISMSASFAGMVSGDYDGALHHLLISFWTLMYLRKAATVQDVNDALNGVFKISETLRQTVDASRASVEVRQ